jgi:hypothetical protein
MGEETVLLAHQRAIFLFLQYVRPCASRLFTALPTKIGDKFCWRKEVDALVRSCGPTFVCGHHRLIYLYRW